jgi:hypothetical protein
MLKITLKLFLTILLTVISFSASAQEINNCGNYTMKGYLSDGQDYVIKLNNSNSARVYTSFFENFEYQLYVCSPNIKYYKIYIYDIEKKLLFSGTCDKFTKAWNISFKSTIACIIEIVVDGSPKPGSMFNILLGFKEAETIGKTNLK